LTSNHDNACIWVGTAAASASATASIAASGAGRLNCNLSEWSGGTTTQDSTPGETHNVNAASITLTTVPGTDNSLVIGVVACDNATTPTTRPATALTDSVQTSNGCYSSYVIQTTHASQGQQWIWAGGQFINGVNISLKASVGGGAAAPFAPVRTNLQAVSNSRRLVADGPPRAPPAEQRSATGSGPRLSSTRSTYISAADRQVRERTDAQSRRASAEGRVHAPQADGASIRSRRSRPSRRGSPPR
jgi:hypothetical protein